MAIQAGHVLDEELNVEALVLQDEDSGDVLEVQRALRFDAQDRELGQDTYCLVRGGATHYGGLVAWTTSDESLTILLDAAAAEVLELPTSSTLPLSATGAALCREHLTGLTGLPAS